MKKQPTFINSLTLGSPEVIAVKEFTNQPKTYVVRFTLLHRHTHQGILEYEFNSAKGNQMTPACVQFNGALMPQYRIGNPCEAMFASATMLKEFGLSNENSFCYN